MREAALRWPFQYYGEDEGCVQVISAYPLDWEGLGGRTCYQHTRHRLQVLEGSAETSPKTRLLGGISKTDLGSLLFAPNTKMYSGR